MAIKRANKFTSNSCLIKGPSGMGKTKLFAIFAIFYLQNELHVLITGPIDISADAMDKQLSELINDFPEFNIKLLFWVYEPWNKKFSLCHL